jgi:hypothetical protein
MDDTLLKALDAIDPAATSYEEWIHIGMALHKEGYDVGIWDSWSAHDAGRYHSGECQRKWKGFGQTNTEEVTGGTLINIARNYGFEPFEDGMRVLDWNDEISDDWTPTERAIVTDKAWLDIEAEENQLHESSEGWNDSGCIDEAVRYISALFLPEDYVGIVYDAYHKEKEDKWSPANHGLQVKCKELLASLEKAKAKDGDITRAVYSYKKPAGMWIRPNPLDGEGYGNRNVTAYRYALIESDAMPINQQIAIIRELQLPVKMLVYSGGKSVHAIVRVDAKSEKEYRQRVDKLYTECKKNQFIVDEQNKNASRLSRLPGVWRGKEKQYIIAENIGQPSFQAWEDWLEDCRDTLPDIEDLGEILDAPHDLTEELIEGTLRRGHKMLIAGPSKAGKSFLLIELAAAIASGGEWLGKQCLKGKVLYVNLEIDRNSFATRFEEIFDAQGIDRSYIKEIIVWNLRGKTPPLTDLAPRLIRRVRESGLAAIIIDPIYKVITGDENNARDMSVFCNQFDRIATETGAAVIYVHHHSKGSQIGKRSMDRASGSGVFARDPDALLDMIELAHEDGDGDKTGWRVEATLREFKAWAPVNLWFDFPVHRFDEAGELTHRSVYDSLTMLNEQKSEKKEASKDEAVRAYDELEEWGTDGVPVTDIAARIGKSAQTVKRYFRELPEDFEVVSSIGGRSVAATVRRRQQGTLQEGV